MINIEIDKTLWCGIEWDNRCDVYSVGIIFYYFNTLTIPFEGDNFSSVVKKNRAGIINFKTPELLKIDKSAYELLKKMLSYHKHYRFTAEQC